MRTFAIPPCDYEESLEKISGNPVTVTASLFRDMEEKRAGDYVKKCLKEFKSGHYGKTPLDDVRDNLDTLEEGEGRIVARYEGGDILKSDIFIIAYFSFEEPGVDYNYTTILYCDEY